jgi:hypothetical protein
MTKAVPCNQIKNPARLAPAGFFALSAQRPEPSIFAGRRLRPCEPAQVPQRLAFTGSISKIIGKVDSNNHQALLYMITNIVENLPILVEIGGAIFIASNSRNIREGTPTHV